MLALILTRKLRPIAMGSTSGWLMFSGITARPRATSERTNSGVTTFGMLAQKLLPARRLSRSVLAAYFSIHSIFWFSRRATNSISGVMMPWRA